MLVEVVRDQDTLRTNAIVSELLPLPGSEIAREVQLYFWGTEQQLITAKITKLTPN